VVVVALVAYAVVVGRVGHRHEEAAATEDPPSQVAQRVPTTPHAKAGTGRQAAQRTSDLRALIAHQTKRMSSIWVVVNKTHPIHPLDFRPRVALVRGYQVARPAARPLARLLRAGDAARLGFKIASAFRSYGYQAQVHDAVVAGEGAAAADRVSARPGHSEHQTGLAVDLVTPAHPRCDFSACFAATPAGRWLAENAWRYGFIVRYTRANQAITGYAPEPWHLRYVGRPLAAAMRAARITTLEQVFHVSGSRR
jgi:zinc D-Ala-D-Ala carboxypeptidase